MKKKNIIMIILASILIILLAGFMIYLYQSGQIKPKAAGEVATLSLTPNSGSYIIGSTFNVDIMLNTSGKAVDGVDIFHLHYDPQALQVQDANTSVAGVQITPGTLFPIWSGNSVDTTAGAIAISGMVQSGTSGYIGSGKFATIQFKALKVATTASLYFDSTLGMLNDTNVIEHGTGLDVLLTASGASFVIKDNPPTIDLKINSSDGPVSLISGQSATLSWISTNAASCTASGKWSGTKAASGTESTGVITASGDYILTCTNTSSDSVSDKVTVNITQPSLKTTSVLQGRSNKVASGITLSVYSLGGTTPLTEATNLTTDANGLITISSINLSVGTNYDFKLKVPYFLKKAITNTTMANGMTIDFTTLKAGDLNNDGIVNSADFTLMNNKWFQADAVADINQDGIVNTADYSWINLNWFATDQ